MTNAAPSLIDRFRSRARSQWSPARRGTEWHRDRPRRLRCRRRRHASRNERDRRGLAEVRPRPRALGIAGDSRRRVVRSLVAQTVGRGPSTSGSTRRVRVQGSYATRDADDHWDAQFALKSVRTSSRQRRVQSYAAGSSLIGISSPPRRRRGFGAYGAASGMNQLRARCRRPRGEGIRATAIALGSSDRVTVHHRRDSESRSRDGEAGARRLGDPLDAPPPPCTSPLRGDGHRTRRWW